MSESDKKYCVNNLSSLTIKMLKKKNPNITILKLMEDFFSSSTYEQLCDLKTELWKEGPAYIFGLYQKEQKQN